MKSFCALVLILGLCGCSTNSKASSAAETMAPARAPSTAKSETCFGKVEEIRAIDIMQRSKVQVDAAVTFCASKINQRENQQYFRTLLKRCDGKYASGVADVDERLAAACRLNAAAFVKSWVGETESWEEFQLVPNPGK